MPRHRSKPLRSCSLLVALSVGACALAYAGEANRAPIVVEAPDSLQLQDGDREEIELDEVFRDPDGDRLRYSAESSHPEVVYARASRRTLRLSAYRPGAADIEVEAKDPDGLSVRLEFEVDVTAPPCPMDPAQAPEGGTAVVMAELRAAVEPETTVLWRAVPDRDPNTADADAGEHLGVSGETEFASWERCARIHIPVADDDEAEPAREWFAVELRLRYGGSARLTRRLVPVAVLEGVCDRSPAVRAVLLAKTRIKDCEAPAPADLASVRSLDLGGLGLGALAAKDLAELPGLRTLDLRGNALTSLPTNALADLVGLHTLRLSDNALSALPADAFAGLGKLRALRLERNALRTLPDGLFTGLESLQQLRLEGNPGAPFALAVQLERSGADPWAPSPARLRVAVPTGAPFDVSVDMLASGGTFADGASTVRARVAGGGAFSRSYVLRSTAGFAEVSLSVPMLSPPCFGARCWGGFELVAGAPLTVFARPPRVLSAPTPATLFGTALQLPLSSLAVSGEPGGRLEWRARSSNTSLAQARVVGGMLVVEPEPGVAGTVLVEAVATDRNGQTATVRFAVDVEAHWPMRPTRGWRGTLSPD